MQINTPVEDNGIIPRPRVTDLIASGVKRYRCICVMGQTGWGKTVAVTQWARECGEDVLWFSLKDKVSPAADIAEAERVGGSSIVVLDDFQCLKAEDKREVCKIVLSGKLKYIIISRAYIPAELRAELGHTVTILREMHLKFTERECEELYDYCGIDQNRAALSNIYDRHYGWALGLHFLTLNIIVCGVPFSKDIYGLTVKSVYEYFDRELMDNRDERSRRLMLTVGCFSSVTLSEIKTITEMDDAADIIEEIMQEGTFFKETAPYTYTTHEFFRKYVADRQSKYLAADDVAACYVRAGRVFEKSGKYRQALECYLNCGDTGSLANLLERISREGVGESKIWEYRRFYNALPKERIEISDDLCAAMCMVCLISFDIEGSKMWLGKLEQMLAECQRGSQRYRELEGRITHLYIALPYKRKTNFISMIYHFARSNNGDIKVNQKLSLTANRPSTYNGGRDFSPYCHYIPKLAPLFEAASVKMFGSDAVGCTDAGVAEWYYLQNKMDEALVSAVRGENAARQGGEVKTLFALMYIQMRILIADGKMEAAETMLANVRRIAVERGAYYLLDNIEAVSAWLCLYKDDRVKAFRWLELYAPDETAEIVTLDRFRYMIKLRCYLAQNRNVEMLALAERLLPQMEMFGRNIELCEKECLIAISYFRQRNKTQAFEHIKNSLALAQKYKLLRTIADEGMPAAMLLQEYMNNRGRTAFAAQVCEAARKIGVLYQNYMALPLRNSEELNDMECSILRLISGGKSYEETAEILGIRVAAAKLYGKSICEKLDVKNKAQAVAKAKEMMII